MSDPYQYWKSALAGEKPKMYVDDPQPGFYRRAIYTKEPNKAAKRTGWTPVAIYPTLGGKRLTAVIGCGADAKYYDDDKLGELWSFVAANPISEATYRAVAERGEPWPDSHETVIVPVAESASPADAIKDLLDQYEKALRPYIKIESDEAASRARDLQTSFLELKSKAENAYEEVNRPLLDEQKRLRGIWFPLRDRADNASKTLRRAMGAWEDVKRAAAKQAETTGEPANAPAPSTQIKGGAGRAASVTVEKVVTAIDVDKVFEQFKTAPQVLELLTILAQKAIRSGIAVPGATVEERSNVR